VLRAVLFDYGLTLVSFTYPRAELLRVLEEVRPWLGPDAPDAATLLREVLEPLEDELDAIGEDEVDAIGEDEVDYLAVYDRAWRRAGLEVPAETLYRILDLEQRCWDRTVQVASDAPATLERLRARGLRTATVSNAPFPPEMLHRQVRDNGIAGLVDVVLFSSEIGRRKPAPEPYLAALERVGAAPDEALFVGDRVVEDHDAPRRLGMQAVLCTALARRPIPDGVATIARLSELDAFLERVRVA
jgi:HAD superfamily hydrolase (TIGR01509 family)